MFVGLFIMPPGTRARDYPSPRRLEMCPIQALDQSAQEKEVPVYVLPTDIGSKIPEQELANFVVEEHKQRTMAGPYTIFTRSTDCNTVSATSGLPGFVSKQLDSTGAPLVKLFGLSERNGQLVVATIPLHSCLLGTTPNMDKSAQITSIPNVNDFRSYIKSMNLDTTRFVVAIDVVDILQTREAWTISITNLLCNRNPGSTPFSQAPMQIPWQASSGQMEIVPNAQYTNKEQRS